MPPMMKNDPKNIPPEDNPDTDEKGWSRLYEHIRLLAIRKSGAMIMDEEDGNEQFDRGARALRTLMGAAEVARRMKRQDEKDMSLHAGENPKIAVTDEEIRRIYRSVVAKVEHIEREMAAEPDGVEGGEAGDRGAPGADPGKVLGDRRS